MRVLTGLSVGWMISMSSGNISVTVTVMFRFFFTDGATSFNMVVIKLVDLLVFIRS